MAFALNADNGKAFIRALYVQYPVAGDYAYACYDFYLVCVWLLSRLARTIPGGRRLCLVC